MKVLQIIISPPLKNNTNSVTGPEKRAARLADKWGKEGIDIVFCYPHRGQMLNFFKNTKQPVIDFEIGNKFNFFAIIKLIRIIKRYEIELVHCQGPASLDLIAAISGKLSGVKVIITRPVMLNDQIHYSLFKRRVYEIIDRFVTLSLLDNIIVVSKKGYKTLKERYKINENKLTLIYNGVESTLFNYEKKKYLSSGQIMFGMIAQLFPPKGWKDFIATVEYIKKRTSVKFKAVIVGEGEMRSELEQLVFSKGLQNNVEFKGFVENIPKLLEQLDFILFTSHREGLSVAILEGMAAGLPHVATNVGGAAEQIIDGETGFLFNVGDIEGMGKACLKFLENPNLIKRFGVRARKIAEEKFSEKSMFYNHVKVYKKVINEKD